VKLKKLALALCMFSLLSGNVKALATRQEMLQVFPEAVLDSLSEEQYNKYATLDYDNIQTQEIIVPYSDYPEQISPFNNLVATGYKRLVVHAVPYDNLNYAISLTNEWLQMPVVRSFDVIALRFQDIAIDEGTQTGYQAYTLSSNNTTQAIGYSYNGTNMVIKENGYGISMNLVNNDITYLENFTSVDVALNGTIPIIWGSYQHAVNNVSLAQSQNYNISAAGLGYVINFHPSVDPYYDAMPGVRIEL